MKSPFDNTEIAFEPFFDTPISVEGVRENTKVAGTFYACVFDNGYADPYTEADADTVIRTFAIQLRAGDWLEGKPPQIGDTVTVQGLPKKLAVSRVESELGEIWELTAKETHE